MNIGNEKWKREIYYIEFQQPMYSCMEIMKEMRNDKTLKKKI